MALVDAPDEVRVQAPSHGQGCGQGLDDVPARRRARRQVVDIPPVRARVIEHQAVTRCCPGCGTETSGAFPPEVTAPVQYGPGVATLAVYLTQEQLLPLARTSAVLAEVCGCPVSEGTVERAIEECHERLAEVDAVIKQGVTDATVAHFDETGVNVHGATSWVHGATSWVHGASTPRLTFYAAHKKRGRAAMDAIGVAPRFRGRAVHDGLASYWQDSQWTHALCNAHHLRELTFVEEHLGQSGATDLKGLLREIKRAVDDARGQGLTGLADDARGQGLTGLADDARQAFARRYDALLEEGMRANPPANPPPPPTGTQGRPKRGKAGSLVDRLRAHKEATLAFMEDLTVPFDNNQAERDIRMTKVREKISGCFRTPRGAERFCRMRGYISTLRKQGMPILSALGQALTNTPPCRSSPSPTDWGSYDEEG